MRHKRAEKNKVRSFLKRKRIKKEREISFQPRLAILLTNIKEFIWQKGKRWREMRSFQILKAVGSRLMTQLSEAGNSPCKAQLSSSKRRIVNCSFISPR